VRSFAVNPSFIGNVITESEAASGRGCAWRVEFRTVAFGWLGAPAPEGMPAAAPGNGGVDSDDQRRKQCGISKDGGLGWLCSEYGSAATGLRPRPSALTKAAVEAVDRSVPQTLRN
jgi:hypothetical protein